nr:immunoglobulin light chain junction region [Macaca mulatta]
CQQESSIPTF